MKTPNFFLLDRPYMIRRIVFVWVIGMFTYSLWWIMDFAQHSPRPGVDVAAIIAAINAPLSFLVGAVLTFWKDINEKGT